MYACAQTHARARSPPPTPPHPSTPLRVSQLPKQVHSILIGAIFTHTHGPRKYPVKQWARLFAASANSNRTGTLQQAKPPLRKLSGNFQSSCELMQFGAAALNRTGVALCSDMFSRHFSEDMNRFFISTVWTSVHSMAFCFRHRVFFQLRSFSQCGSDLHF